MITSRTMTEEFRDLGNGVTLSVHVARLARDRSIGSSGFVELRFTTVATWANGLLERFLNYADVDEARATAERLAEERG